MPLTVTAHDLAPRYHTVTTTCTSVTPPT